MDGDAAATEESWWRWLLLLSKLNLGLDSVSFFGVVLFCCFSSSLGAWPPTPAPVPLLFLLLALTDCRSSPLGPPLLLSLLIASLSSFIFQSASLAVVISHFCGRNREKRSADLLPLLWFWALLLMLLLLLLFVAKFNACGNSGEDDEWKLNAAAEAEDVEGGRGKNGDAWWWWWWRWWMGVWSSPGDSILMAAATWWWW